MGGYALYVWGSYGVTLILMVMEMLLLILRKRSLLGQLRHALSARRVSQ